MLHGGGGQDPIIRRVRWIAPRSVCGDHGEWIAGGGEGTAGVLGDVGIDFDAGDVGGAEAVGEQGGVVASPGADLQDPHPGVGMEGVEHAGHDVGLAGRAGDVAAMASRPGGVPVVHLGDHRARAVSAGHPLLGILAAVQRN